MPLEMFLNELSMLDGNIDEASARQHFKEFVGAVRAISKIDRNAVFNADISVNAMKVGENFSVASLRNHSACVEESQFLKALQGRSPFEKVVDQLGRRRSEEFDYRIASDGPWNDQIASGLGLAHLYSGLGISFASHEFWKQGSIPLKLNTLDEQSGDIETSAVTALNCYSAEQSEMFRRFAEERLAFPRDGAETWDRRAELFPNLVFIPRVKSQLCALLKGERVFDAVYVRLREIDRSVGDWRESESGHPTWPFRVRPESGTRIAEGLVTFQTEDGVHRIFSDHCDFTPDEGRIHFILESQPARSALIGHVGRKLGIG